MLCLPTLFIVAAVLVLLWWFFSQFFRSAAGRVVVMLAMLVIGTALLAQSITDPANAIPLGGAIGLILLLLGCVQLGLIIWSIIATGKEKQAQEANKIRMAQLSASGLLLPVPPLPPLPAWLSREEQLREDELARTMAHVVWGERPQFSTQEMWRVFDRAMELLRQSESGERRALDDASKLLMVAPPPCCYIGGAEVLLRLAHRQGDQFYPAVLILGLQLIYKAQLYDPVQPEALFTRIRLLAAGGSPEWLALAGQTLALFKQVAPNHPSIAGAERALAARMG